jgi:hypothetical protein
MLGRCDVDETTKIQRILDLLVSGRTLNRFEAESHGDHCLNSTIAVLRRYGYKIVGTWEYVWTRFDRQVRVLRYSYVGRA